MVALNVERDHVHMIVLVPPKEAISEVMGRVKGQTATRLFKQFSELRKKPYWGNLGAGILREYRRRRCGDDIADKFPLLVYVAREDRQTAWFNKDYAAASAA